MKDLIFYVYIDYTTEEIPRPFYVGKGVNSRVKWKKRNEYWQNIANKHGHHRELILATKDEQDAFSHEIRLIAELKTFENGEPERWGANLTEGGEGFAGGKHSPESIAKMSGPNNHNYGKPKSEETLERMRKAHADREPASDETRKRISEGRTGIGHTDEARQKISVATTGERNPFFGKKHSDESLEKMRSAATGRVATPETLEKLSKKSKGENNPAAKLTWEKVREIRIRHVGGTTQIALAREFDVNRDTIHCIVANKRWKEISDRQVNG